jgi:acyl-coenzyme A thioesterase PaaI-like protein
VSQEGRRFAARGWGADVLPASGVWQERRRLADAMRVVIERLITSNAPEEELREATRRLEQYAEHLATHPRRMRYEGSSESALAQTTRSGRTPPPGDASASANAAQAEGSGDTVRGIAALLGAGHFDYSPLIGRSNPLAPPIEMGAEGDRVHGRVVFGSAYEGPPGCLHGGYVAAAFDEVLGFAQSLSGSPGMTGTLRVVYRSPTPLHEELRFEAWVDRVEGRKIFTRSTLHAGERLCAEAEGIFISIVPATFKRLIEQRDRRDAR